MNLLYTTGLLSGKVTRVTSLSGVKSSYIKFFGYKAMPTGVAPTSNFYTVCVGFSSSGLLPIKVYSGAEYTLEPPSGIALNTIYCRAADDDEGLFMLYQ